MDDVYQARRVWRGPRGWSYPAAVPAYHPHFYARGPCVPGCLRCRPACFSARQLRSACSADTPARCVGRRHTKLISPTCTKHVHMRRTCCPRFFTAKAPPGRTSASAAARLPTTATADTVAEHDAPAETGAPAEPLPVGGGGAGHLGAGAEAAAPGVPVRLNATALAADVSAAVTPTSATLELSWKDGTCELACDLLCGPFDVAPPDVSGVPPAADDGWRGWHAFPTTLDDASFAASAPLFNQDGCVQQACAAAPSRSPACHLRPLFLCCLPCLSEEPDARWSGRAIVAERWFTSWLQCVCARAASADVGVEYGAHTHRGRARRDDLTRTHGADP